MYLTHADDRFSTVAGQNVFLWWGGGGGVQLAERNLGGSEEKPLKIFEIFIPEIAANASNFKNQLTYMGKLICYHFFSPFPHNYWGGGHPRPLP